MQKRTILFGLIVSLGLDLHAAAALDSPDDPDSKTGSSPALARDAGDTAADPTGRVTLRQALAATLRRSPQLSAYSWEVRSSEALVLQASLRPNPELGINPENFVGSGAFGRQIQYQNTIQLSQLVELGEKRQRRTDVASANRDRTELEYEAKRIEVLGEVTADFIDALSDQEEARIAKLTLDQAADLVKAVNQRVKASVGTSLEEKRAVVLVARARNALRRAERKTRVSRQKLAANWTGRGEDIERVEGDLIATHPLPALETLLARVGRAPDRRLAVADEQIRLAEAALARSRRVADVVVSGAWRQGRNWDDQTVVAGVSFPLKIFDRAQGDIASSDARTERAKVETTAVDVRLNAVVYGLYQEVVQAREETETFTKDIVPRTEEALALARTGFGQGIYSQLDVLDAQRTIVEVRLERIQAAARYHRLVAEVEKLLGTTF